MTLSFCCEMCNVPNMAAAFVLVLLVPLVLLVLFPCTGMVCTILDTPGLASHGNTGQGQALELAERRRMGGVRPGCC